MDLGIYKLIAAVIIFSASMLAVVYPLRKHIEGEPSESLQLGEALASGIFLGAAFFHMLPDSIQLFQQLYPHGTYPIAESICVAGFLLLLCLERFSYAAASYKHVNAIPYILIITLVIHALIEGAALGIGPTLSETLMLFIAIIAHKGSESYALCINLLKHHFAKKTIWMWVGFFALMTPIGISLGAGLNSLSMGSKGVLIEACFNAFAAGSFLYISTLHHVHFHQHARDVRGMAELGCLILGIFLMGIIAIWT